MEGGGTTVVLDRPQPARSAERPHPGGAGLSPREREILALLAHGFSGVKVAESLGIRVATVRTHTMNLKRKLESDTLPGAVGRAQELGLLGERPTRKGRAKRDQPDNRSK